MSWSNGLHAFFVNKAVWIELFGELIKDKDAPSIKDIEDKLKGKGYYIENNDKCIDLIGFESVLEAKNNISQPESLPDKCKSLQNHKVTSSRYGYDKNGVECIYKIRKDKIVRNSRTII